MFPIKSTEVLHEYTEIYSYVRYLKIVVIDSIDVYTYYIEVGEIILQTLLIYGITDSIQSATKKLWNNSQPFLLALGRYDYREDLFY